MDDATRREIERVIADMEGWSTVPRVTTDRCIRRLRALLPAPESLGEAVERFLNEPWDGTPGTDGFTRWQNAEVSRLRAALARRRGEG